jgi:hypothetical protein
MVGSIPIKRKRIQPSNVALLDFLGEHEGMDKYDYKYERKNVNEIRHILSAHSNSSAKFEIGLRSYPDRNLSSRAEHRDTINSMNDKEGNLHLHEQKIGKNSKKFKKENTKENN